MKIRSRFATYLGMLVVALGGILVVATPASANHPGQCSPGPGYNRVCVTSSTVSGTPYYYWTNPAVGACQVIGAPWSTQTKLVSNMLNWGSPPYKKVNFYNNSTCSSSGLVTGLTGTNDYAGGHHYWWAYCANTDPYRGLYGSPATWVTANSSCGSPNVRSFKVTW